MEIDAYCARNGCAGPRSPPFEVLAALARCHLQTVPPEHVTAAAGCVLALAIPRKVCSGAAFHGNEPAAQRQIAGVAHV